MIVVTGAAGFIGSCMVSKLNKLGSKDIIIVDEFKNKSTIDKIKMNIDLQRRLFDSFVRAYSCAPGLCSDSKLSETSTLSCNGTLSNCYHVDDSTTGLTE